MATRLPLHILLAEDNIVNQRLALHMLERLGYRADVAANGLEVLAAIARQSYDVVLMDVQMPEMDGREATRRIRATPPHRSQPHIVALTADATQQGREACFNAGMDDYISKPIKVPELVAALNRCQPDFAQPRAAQLPAAPPPASPDAEPLLSLTLDVATLRRLKASLGRRADEKFAALLESFHESSERLLKQARDALAQEDHVTLNRAAHTLKSTCATMGVHQLADLAQELEHLSKDSIPADAEARIAQAEAEYQRAKAALENESW